MNASVSARAIADDILDTTRQIQESERMIQELTTEENWYRRWGKISRQDSEELRQAGIYLRLYICDKKSIKKLPPDTVVYTIHREASRLFCALISKSKEVTLGLKEVTIPERSFDQSQRMLAEARQSKETAVKRLRSNAQYRAFLQEALREYAKKLEFTKVKFGLGKEEGVVYCQGYCPVDTMNALKEKAVAQGWGYWIRDPLNPEDVPTLIRLPRWLRSIQPVFSFMQTVPGYKEYDISFWFLVFFSLFFAMLIGDAGYGVLFLIATVFFQRNSKRLTIPLVPLLYILSSATILWGLLSGTWFGSEQIAKLPLIQRLSLPSLNSFTGSNQYFLMYLCFVIGVVQLTIAHCIAAVRTSNSLRALAEIGWIGILWCIFYLAGYLVLNKPYPSFASTAFIVGMSLVLLFSHPEKKIFKSIGASLGDLPLKLINSFGDILSYLRLFAVGYATVMISATFNTMALNLGFGSFVSSSGAALILFGGHALNICLGLMSVLVHGIRLNMLEFSGHLNMEWSGFRYQPFRE
jgi:V/A-type H+-transporting ATPase subunit I